MSLRGEQRTILQKNQCHCEERRDEATPRWARQVIRRLLRRYAPRNDVAYFDEAARNDVGYLFNWSAAFSIFAQESLSVTTRLNTGLSDV